jgi:dienelactone hydrolase
MPARPTLEHTPPIAPRRAHRAAAILAAIVLLVSLGTACDRLDGPSAYFTSIDPPPGDAPLRYRDPVFPAISLTSNIPWSTAPDLDGNPVALTLDMYQPTGDTATQRPALVVAHSGGFYVHNKTDHVSVDTANYYASLGYVVISINYRLLAKVDCGSLQGAITDISGCKTAAMAATSDGQAAVRWLRANAATYRVDPNRIAMSGDSAGAIMSILAGMLPDVADNPTDPLSIETMAGAPLNPSNPEQSSKIQAWLSISGGLPPTETPGLAEKLAAAQTLPAPGYLFSGTADNQVPYSWAEATRDELVKIHRIVGWGSLQGAGHVPWTTTDKTLMLSQSSNFFYLMLGLGSADQYVPPAAA